jgi:hypothetical protein
MLTHTLNPEQVTKVNQPELKTRELAMEWAEAFANGPHRRIILDLSEVEFMSRSFADQLYKEKKRLALAGTIIECIGKQEQVLYMLQAVADTQNRTDRHEVNLKPVHYTTAESAFAFLLSL